MYGGGHRCLCTQNESNGIQCINCNCDIPVQRSLPKFPFLINVGCQKCGTTSLRIFINQHLSDEIQCSAKKEQNFWQSCHTSPLFSTYQNTNDFISNRNNFGYCSIWKYWFTLDTYTNCSSVIQVWFILSVRLFGHISVLCAHRKTTINPEFCLKRRRYIWLFRILREFYPHKWCHTVQKFLC